MGLFSSVFNIIKKPIDMALKKTGCGVSILSSIISIYKHFKSSGMMTTVPELTHDVRILTTEAYKNGEDVNILSTEASSYLSAMTNEFVKMNTELGISKRELDEYTALYILERLNCPQSYIEAIIKTLTLKNKIKDSGILNDAIETSKLHVSNVKNTIKVAKDLCSVDYLMEELDKDMTIKNIYTPEGVALASERENQLNDFRSTIKYKASEKNFNRMMTNVDKIFVDNHKTETDNFYEEYFDNIKKNSNVNSDEFIFAFGKVR